MKNHLPLLRQCSLGSIVAFSLVAGLSSLAAQNVEISYEEPEKFSDMGGSHDYFFDKNTFEYFKDRIQEKMESLADRYLPSDSTLTMSVRDVDLAGEVEPWVSTIGTDIRVLRDIYPPRIKFHFKVAAEDGEVLREGVAQLTDMSYLWGVNTIRSDRKFYYEKELLEDWARKTLEDISQTGS